MRLEASDIAQEKPCSGPRYKVVVWRELLLLLCVVMYNHGCSSAGEGGGEQWCQHRRRHAGMRRHVRGGRRRGLTAVMLMLVVALAMGTGAAAQEEEEGGGTVVENGGSSPANVTCSLEGVFVDLRIQPGTANMSLPLDPELNAELTLYYALSGAEDERVAFGIEYRRFSSNTQEPSWIGLGVGDMGMIDSDMVVADFTDDLPGLLLEEYWSVTYGNPISKITLGEDAQNGLGDCGFETFEYGENMSKSLGMATSTYLQFSRPLVADSEYSRPLVPGTINEMVYAVGTSNSPISIYMKMMKYESELQCGFRVGGAHGKRDPQNTNPEQTVSSLYFIVMHFLRIVHMSESHVSTCARSCTSIFGWLHPTVVAKLVQYQMLTIQRALVRLIICIASLFYVSMTHMQASTSSTSLIPSSITAQSTGGAFRLICPAVPVRRRTSRRRSAPAAPALQ